MTTVARENGLNMPHERLASTLAIDAPGYVYIYLSNEEATPLEVYFDDLSVTQVMGPVIQQTDYDPFGLTFGEYNREGSEPNQFLYNGKELQTDFDLSWYDYGARMYDAALGRWHVIDPMTEQYTPWSPYNYTLNNPLKFIDRDGRKPIVVGAANADDFNKAMDAIKALREIPGAAEVVNGIEDSEYTVTIILADDDRSKQVLDDSRGAFPKGVKFYHEGKMVAGTGKGSSVIETFPVSSRGTTPEEFEAALGEILGIAYESVKGNLSPVIVETPDDLVMFRPEIQGVNVENYVRVYHRLPFREKSYLGAHLFDPDGSPLVPGLLSKRDIEVAINAKIRSEFKFWPSINRAPPP